MGGIAFAGPLTVGAALLAVWADCRLSERRPATPMRRFVHAGVAFAILQIASALAAHIAGGGSRANGLAAIFFLLLPSLVYSFVAGVWLIRTLADAARLAGR
jgi:hypothetical protein